MNTTKAKKTLFENGNINKTLLIFLSILLSAFFAKDQWDKSKQWEQIHELQQKLEENSLFILNYRLTLQNLEQRLDQHIKDKQCDMDEIKERVGKIEEDQKEIWKLIPRGSKSKTEFNAKIQ